MHMLNLKIWRDLAPFLIKEPILLLLPAHLPLLFAPLSLYHNRLHQPSEGPRDALDGWFQRGIVRLFVVLWSLCWFGDGDVDWLAHDSFNNCNSLLCSFLKVIENYSILYKESKSISADETYNKIGVSKFLTLWRAKSLVLVNFGLSSTGHAW